jgi:arsenate reductase
MSKAAVLFLGNGNAARSQMAEAFLVQFAGDRFDVYSAGLEPTGIHPLTVQVMQEAGIALDGQRSKDVMEYMGRRHFGYLITVCSRVETNCPRAFPGVSVRVHWNIEDPRDFEGSSEARLTKYRAVRDQVEKQIKAWLHDMSDEG